VEIGEKIGVCCLIVAFCSFDFNCFAEVHCTGLLDVENDGVWNSNLGSMSKVFRRCSIYAYLNTITHILGFEDNLANSFDLFLSTRYRVSRERDGLRVGTESETLLPNWLTRYCVAQINNAMREIRVLSDNVKQRMSRDDENRTEDD